MIDGKLLYPIGSIYMSIQDTNPSVFFGGTWERIAKGKTLVGVDENDTDFNVSSKTGGEKTHRHDFRLGFVHAWGDMGADNTDKQGAYSFSQSKFNKESGTGATVNVNMNGNHIDSLRSVSATVRYSTGDTDLESSLSPYYTCYIFVRTA